MIEARAGHTATLLLDGTVLVAGGYFGSFGPLGNLGPLFAALGPPFGSLGLPVAALGPLASAELYDPSSGSWTATGGMIEARIFHTATLLPDGTVLVAGGFGLATAELYDPSSGSWTATGAMDGFRAGHTATLLPDGTVLVAGGSSFGEGSVLTTSAELYDPRSGSWTATGGMIEARTRHTATLLPDGKVLVAGGPDIGNGLPQASAELYDPSSGSWTATGRMIEARADHTATLLLDGRVLLAGGTSGGTSGVPLGFAELFDPSTGSWTATGTMDELRAYQTATLLPDGRVLVAGGNSRFGSALSFAELYDPGSGSWTATGRMIEARADHTATLLPDGKVLVAGGDSSSGLVTPAEVYDPSSGS